MHNLSKNNADGVSRRKQIRGMFYGTESYRKGCGDFRGGTGIGKALALEYLRKGYRCVPLADA